MNQWYRMTCLLTLAFFSESTVAKIDLSDSLTSAFGGGCQSQGSYTKRALGHNANLKKIIKNIQKDSSCLQWANSLDGILEQGSSIYYPSAPQSLDKLENEISELDLSSTSHLKYLACPGNPIAFLDLSSVPNLRLLDCSKIAATSLNFVMTPKLRWLTCGDLPFGSLKLDSLIELRTLLCPRCELSELDLSKNKKLVALVCYDNQLRELDLSELPQLRYLQCENNPFSKLDLSYSMNLKSIKCDSGKFEIVGREGRFDNWREDIVRPPVRLFDGGPEKPWSWRKSGWSVSSDPVFSD